MTSIIDGTDSNYDQVSQILTRQKTATENALRRKGERPEDLPPRAQSISEFTMASLSNQMSAMQSRTMMMNTVIGNPYPPSIARFEELEKLFIKDLRLETNHRGHYLLLRFVCPAMRMTAVSNVAEDELGTVVAFALYMQVPDTARAAGSILKEKGVIILKEPYFKLSTNGQYAVRVDQPTDIIWLSEDDPRVPKKWRGSSTAINNSAEHWKKKGNTLVGKANFYDAIEMYSRALRSSPTPDEKDILHRNRALSYIKIEAFDAALRDASSLDDPQEKGLYRKALALYGLRRYMEAFEVLQELVSKYPDSVSGKHELSRCRLRLAEEESGTYDFTKLYKAAKLRPPLMDNANYTGPVEIRESKGRGRGLFVKQAVKAGDLLLCEKAFSYCFAATLEELAKTRSKSQSRASYLMDVPRNRIIVGTHADLICETSSKLTLNPSLKPPFEDLFRGQFGDGIGTPVDGVPVVDTYINHSCDSTCARTFIGDLMIVRAARDMPADTELTFRYLNIEDPVELNKKAAEGWGFQCDCAHCIDDRDTPRAMKVQRSKLIRAFHGPNAGTRRKEEIIKQLDKTYQRPPSEVPRLQMWDLHFQLATEAAGRAKAKEVIGHILATFESVGFIIEGARVDKSPTSNLTVRQWGCPNDNATSAWLTLRNAYKALGKNNLAEQAKELARITYMLLAGEDATFIYENPQS